MQDCIFCRIVRGEIADYRVWENDEFIAFLDVRPINEGHTLIVSREHFDYVFDMDDEIYGALFSAGKKIAPAIKEVTGAPRVGLVIEGFGVPHVHLHLIPIYHGNELDPHRAHEVPTESLKDMQAKLKGVLRK